MRKQKLILIILLGILALALLYAFWATPRQRRVAAPETAPSAGRPAETVQTESPAAGDESALRVRLELLQREPEAVSGYERDIFHFPPVWRPSPPVAAAPSPPPPRAEPERPPTEAIMPPQEVRRELARFTFLGYLLKDSTRTVFLESGEDIFVVKRGDRFGEEDEFLVTNLTPEALTIRQRGDERPILVPLVEQAPLIPRRMTAPGPRPGWRPNSSPGMHRDFRLQPGPEPDMELDRMPEEPDMEPEEPDMEPEEPEEPDMVPEEPDMQFGPSRVEPGAGSSTEQVFSPGVNPGN